ncbi:MAG TPA: tetratricopeptide repeat protein [bacterium]|nr:tetratricopeptide repeat protein [bacterium]HPQ66828.1 tetratricopeptide repeat protein [bacterium]
MKKFWQRLGLIFFGLFLGALLLEAGLRGAGAIFSALQERENRRSLAGKGREGKEKYVILCLGESTTVIGDYPRKLEELLNRWAGRECFAVVNKGIPATNSTAILKDLAGNIEEYRPDMVIAMVGINDYRGRVRDQKAMVPCPELDGRGPWYAQSKVYKLAAAIIDHARPLVSGEPLDMETIYAQNLEAAESPVTVEEEDITMKKAREYWDEDHFAEVEFICRRLLQGEPGHRGARMLLVQALREQGKVEEARLLLEGLLDEFPRDTEIVLSHARLLSFCEDYEGAAEEFARAEELNPNASSPPAELAIAYMDLGRLDRAREAADRAIALAPERRPWLEKVIEQRIKSCIQYGAWSRAIELGELTEDLGIESGGIQAQVGLAYHYLRDFERSRAACRKALELDPRATVALETLAAIFYEEDDLVRSERCLVKALKINLETPDRPPGLAFNELTKLYVNDSESGWAKLEALCRKVLRYRPENERVMATFVVCLEAQEKYEQAKQWRRKAAFLLNGLAHPQTARNYRKIIETVRERGIEMVCVQYPVRPLRHLQNLLGAYGEEVIFVDNEAGFKEAVEEEGVGSVFNDLFAGDFGHFTTRGAELLAGNIAQTLIDSGLLEGVRREKATPVP